MRWEFIHAVGEALAVGFRVCNCCGVDFIRVGAVKSLRLHDSLGRFRLLRFLFPHGIGIRFRQQYFALEKTRAAVSPAVATLLCRAGGPDLCWWRLVSANPIYRPELPVGSRAAMARARAVVVDPHA